ncbi:DNRLRE domain-containing protein [Paenibacillus sp. GSMTC-2017]|uniref:CBM96 family carbohydrate-binding protein n=1 Tax=Paenibacillus sp. GSMTC-2017 TaxID=2794350 RepID=UPI0018D7998C|nr:DNRLRE domain-containing protein [Paenibacillus sp. GSMTC-2017]MBH5318370.1 DNRLRE domain-containing protein [Paenibacillus sp. GSMTC-2017]
MIQVRKMLKGSQIRCIYLSILSSFLVIASLGMPSAQAAVDPSLPDWSTAGYKGGQALPTTGTIIDLTTKGIAANDGVDDSNALQQVINDIRSGVLKANGQVISEFNRAILKLPAGQIDLNKQIRVDASFITIQGAGNDPTTGTKIVFKPSAIYSEDPANQGAPLIDGKLWPGYAAFRVEDRTKHASDQTYEGSINFHWLSGQRVATSGGGIKGSTQIKVASGKGNTFQAGNTVYVGAANTVAFYDQMQGPQQYRYNAHMRTQMFTVVSISGDTLTLDKPLEFDVPFSNEGLLPADPGGSNSIYYSKVMKVTTVKGVGFEDFYFTQDISYTPYASTINANDYDATANPGGVGLKYKNEALEYAVHGILFKWAQDGWVKGIQTYMTGSHPIVTEFAKNMEIRNNIIFGSWNKGKGGHGYVRGSKLYDSKIVGNTIDRVRHLTLQWSATGNVVQHNALTTDINLHGGWERRNLIQQNTITIPFEHSSWGEGEGGQDVLEGTWYPIWYGAGPHATKWSGSTGEQNVFFNNTMSKQETKGGPYISYAPYNQLNTIYQLGWDGSAWTHLQKPSGMFINTWGSNEKTDFSNSPNKGVYACLTFTGTSLLDAGTATNTCASTDTEAPTAPTGLTATPISNSQINVNWVAATDNVGVTSYQVYRDTLLIGETIGTTYSDTGLTASTTYSYSIKAKDAAGNLSPLSNIVQATTLAGGGSGTVVTLNPTDDSYVQENKQTNNYGNLATMAVKTDTSQNRYSLLKFNVSSITGSITSAKLRIYGSSSFTTTLTASEIADSWTEATLTWNNKPATGNSVGSVAMNTTLAYYEIDVTAYVLAEAAGDDSASFILSESAGKYTTFNTSENTLNKPELIVTN